MRLNLPESDVGVQQRFRPTWAEVSLTAFASNVRALRDLAGSSRLLAVLKADAYGHGAAALAPVALENGADSIGVSSIEEGISLREAGIKAPVLILGSIYPMDNFPAVLGHDLTPTIHSLEAAQIYADAAAALSRTADFHLKVDTGMGRLGVSPAGARPILEWAAEQTAVRLAGVYSHFASADSDVGFTRVQLNQITEIRKLARGLGVSALFHIANSAALISLPASRLDMVRPGIALYGLPTVPLPSGVALLPVLSWKSRIVFQKRIPAGTSISYGRTWKAAVDSYVATVPVGYADGLPRAVTGKAEVLVGGRRRPVIGRVTMDHIVVDLTGLKADLGDEVVIIGAQGEERITADDWAGWAGTISYEILTGISKRVPRVVTE